MQVVSIISTKGGVGKTTTAANLGGFIADADRPARQVQEHMAPGQSLEAYAAAGGQHVVHFLTQTGEVGGKNRRGDSERLHDDLG